MAQDDSVFIQKRNNFRMPLPASWQANIVVFSDTDTLLRRVVDLSLGGVSFEPIGVSHSLLNHSFRFQLRVRDFPEVFGHLKILRCDAKLAGAEFITLDGLARSTLNRILLEVSRQYRR